MNAIDRDLQELYGRLGEIHLLRGISGLLDWDQQVCMPDTAQAFRVEQRTYLARRIHALLTDREFETVLFRLRDCVEQLSDVDSVNVRETVRSHEHRSKLPVDFVAERAAARAEAYGIWRDARQADDFSAARPALERNVELAQREADLIGYSDSPYDPLLDDFEPGMTLSELQPLFKKLGEELGKLVPRIRDLVESWGVSEQQQYLYPLDQQQTFCTEVAAVMGFDFERGRLDTTTHPFASKLCYGDTRITTRYDESSPLSALLTVMHEAGHGIYEQGLLPEQEGRPVGQVGSLGLHEMQSRVWENFVGRSAAFSEYLQPVLSKHFGSIGALESPQAVWRALNRVTPSLIRVEADEVTYSLHVIIRTKLEVQLISSELAVKDLPEAWSALYKQYLDIDVPDARRGVLQDVHWWHVGFGYFPTYVLGNIYAGMAWEVIDRDIPNLSQQLSDGDFSEFLSWQAEHVHRHGMTFSAVELVERFAGQALSVEPFVRYIEGKFFG